MYMCVCIHGYVEIECRVAEYLLSVTLCVCVCHATTAMSHHRCFRTKRGFPQIYISTFLNSLDLQPVDKLKLPSIPQQE